LGKGNGEDLLLVLLERKWRSVSCIVSGYITWLIVRDGNVVFFFGSREWRKWWWIRLKKF
jgi:hypothetical protein